MSVKAALAKLSATAAGGALLAGGRGMKMETIAVTTWLIAATTPLITPVTACTIPEMTAWTC